MEFNIMITITQTLASNVIHSVYNPMIVRLTSDVTDTTLRIKATVKKTSDDSVLGTLTAFKVLGEFRFDFSNLLKAFVPKIPLGFNTSSSFNSDETVLQVKIELDEVVLNEFNIADVLNQVAVNDIYVAKTNQTPISNFSLSVKSIARKIKNLQYFKIDVFNISTTGLIVNLSLFQNKQLIDSSDINIGNTIRGNKAFFITPNFANIEGSGIEIVVSINGNTFTFIEDTRNCNGIKTIYFRTSLGGFDLYNFAKIGNELTVAERSSYETYNQDDNEKHTQIDYYTKQSNVTTVESSHETDEIIEYLSSELLASTEVYLVEDNGDVITPINIVSTGQGINYLGLNKMTLQYKTKDFINY
jgi:hypothetical protein